MGRPGPQPADLPERPRNLSQVRFAPDVELEAYPLLQSSDGTLRLNEDLPVFPGFFGLEGDLALKELATQVFGEHLVKEMDKIIELLLRRPNQERKTGWFALELILEQRRSPHDC